MCIRDRTDPGLTGWPPAASCLRAANGGSTLPGSRDRHAAGDPWPSRGFPRRPGHRPGRA
eukprot:5510943-Alexandrium_andersonii.AAC.1